jgi:hypothetical protein
MECGGIAKWGLFCPLDCREFNANTEATFVEIKFAGNYGYDGCNFH